MSNKPLRFASLIVVLLLGAEVALRTAGVGDPILLEADQKCGYVMKPNQDHLRFFVHTRINSHSMRSDEFALEKHPDIFRLMFVGDSITYGTSRVDQDKIFTEILRKELPSTLHRHVEVLNASASGWAISNELAYVESRGFFHSDRVVLVLNDGDLSQSKSTLADVGTGFFVDKPACALCELFGRYGHPQRNDKGTDVAADLAQEQSNLRLLSEFRNVVVANGAAMLVFFVPFRKNITANHPVVLQPELVAWAREHNIKIADASPFLASLSVKEASLEDGDHLSVSGNRAVARGFEQSALVALGLTHN